MPFSRTRGEMGKSRSRTGKISPLVQLLKLQLAKYDGTKESDDHAAEMKRQVDDNMSKEIAEFAIAIEDQYEKTQVLREALKKE